MDTADTRDQILDDTHEAFGAGLAPSAPPAAEFGQPVIEAEETQDTGSSVSPFRAAARRFLRDKRATASLILVLLIIVFSFVFPPFYQHLGPPELGGNSGHQVLQPAQYHTYDFQDLTQSDAQGTLISMDFNAPFLHPHFGSPDAWFHPLGADLLGRDILARLLAGINVSIELALLVEVFDVGLGILLGVLAGWYGGWLGMALDRFTDVMFAFPGLLLIVLMGASLGPLFDKLFTASLGPVYARVFMLLLALGILAWPLMMRYVRGQTLQLKEQQYVEAARVVGTSDRKIIMRHIVPNLMNVVVVASTLSILGTIIGEAGLSELGVGIRAPGSSLGLMIADGTGSLYTSPGELIWPVIVLVTIVVAFSFVGDGVRDAFDPRTKD